MAIHSFDAHCSALHVADVAQVAGVTPATVRYYARVKLLSPKRNPENGYRCFSLSDVHRVEFIRQAQSLGLTIADIKTVLATIDSGEQPCHQVKVLVQKRLRQVRGQIAELKSIEARMAEALKVWDHMDSPTPRDGEFCALIGRAAAGPRQQSASCLPDKRQSPPPVGQLPAVAWTGFARAGVSTSSDGLPRRVSTT